MRDLLTDPLCRDSDVGKPLPDSAHAVSVALPRWEHVIGYEEGDPAVIDQFQTGYPRFFLHPLVRLLQPSGMPQSVRPQCAYPMCPSLRHLHLGWALTLTDNGLLTEPANAAGKPTPSPSEWTAFQPTCLVPVRMLNTGDADSIPMGPTSLTMASLCQGLILNIRVTSNHTVHLARRQARLRQSAHPVPPAQDAVAHQKRAS